MNKKELKTLKTLLLEYREKVSLELDHISKESLNKSQKDASGDLSGYSFHMADVATDNYAREFNLSLASTEQETLKCIDEALKKIEDNTFGICEGCEQKIPVPRLKAMPFTSMCVKCQEEKEGNGHL